MSARYWVVVFSLLQLGCVSGRGDVACNLSASELALLKQRALAFVVDTQDSHCEQILDETINLTGHGCAIYGTPGGGGDCPIVLDGEYFVVFDRATLQPKELVLVAY